MSPKKNNDLISKTVGPYSSVYQVGDFFFVSGQVGVDFSKMQAALGIEEQTHQALTNMAKTLTEVGLTLQHVVKTTIFLQNMDDYKAVNDIYTTYFTEPRPARSCVEVSRLPKVGDKTLLIEIEAIASKGRS